MFKDVVVIHETFAYISSGILGNHFNQPTNPSFLEQPTNQLDVTGSTNQPQG